jgi:hypothetical protein
MASRHSLGKASGTTPIGALEIGVKGIGTCPLKTYLAGPVGFLGGFSSVSLISSTSFLKFFEIWFDHDFGEGDS